MKHFVLTTAVATGLLLASIGCIQQKITEEKENTLNNMKIFVPTEANRPISFTNKEAAYYFTQSHENNHAEYSWFAGLNIAQKRIFSGYKLSVDNTELNNLDAEVWVYPYKMVKYHPNNIIEEFWLFDNQNILEVSLTGATKSIAITLSGEQVHFSDYTNQTVFFTSDDDKQAVIAVAPIQAQRITVNNKSISTPANGKGFYITVAPTSQEAKQLLSQARQNQRIWKEARRKRMQQLLLNNAYMTSTDDSLQLAIQWIITTMDQLLSKQQGYGIYAGLPWFNEYWGRDAFISLPGACLVTGQFEQARNILVSFARYQMTDSNSKYFGRIPNIVKPHTLNYHTADGTPRFICQILEYVKYSGDASIIEELYPTIQNSIEGALKHRVDQKGYLLHEDNETWMDARRDYDQMPYSPRGTRANDIQALWHKQLLAGAFFATHMGDSEKAEEWQRLADNIKTNFEHDFKSTKADYLADRLDSKNVPKFKLRPNQLYALDLIDDEEFKWHTIRLSWEKLVYPWGVASLNSEDTLFHPFHLQWENYHKDEAYHNGTVWLWNNGIAMQRMIEAEQENTAYQLFQNMNRQALTKGVVGGLGENMDAYPHQGESWPKLTGTYLQAWSNAEHLRVWYQYFLGIRPNMINKQLTLAPRIPKAINQLDYNFIIDEGQVTASYIREGETEQFNYTFINLTLEIDIDIFPFEKHNVTIRPGYSMEILNTQNKLMVRFINPQKEIINETEIKLSKERITQKTKLNDIFRDIQFCTPIDLINHPVMEKRFDPQITDRSI
ncbi:hypothetical protein DMA11_18270 [Marinilabiliaceae bacterium JC017]|nr:hypothetical protein DMA11_18270 [Marinilabiliaceae bacterium JC017]